MTARLLYFIDSNQENLISTFDLSPAPCERSGASCGESVDDPTSQVQHLMSSAESGSDR